MAMVGGDERIVDAHDKAVGRTLAWIEGNAVEPRMRDPATGAMVRAGEQKMAAATFRHDTSRNLDPQLHTHCVVANMVQGGDGKWRTMVDDGLFRQQKAIGAIYRAELAQGLGELSYGIEKTHPDGRFKVAGVSREFIEAFSTRRAEIEAAMAERGLGAAGDNPKLADRAALMTRAAKRDMDREELRQSRERQAAELGFSAGKVRANARKAERGLLASACSPGRAMRPGTRRRGRSSIFPSAKRCSAMPTCWRLCPPASPARSPSRRPSGRSRRSNATAAFTPRAASTTAGTGPRTLQWRASPRPSR